MRRDAEMAFNVLRWFPRFEGEVDELLDLRARVLGGAPSGLRSGSTAFAGALGFKKELDVMVGRLGSDEFEGVRDRP